VGVHRHWWLILTVILLPLLLYPFYISISSLLDYFLGDGLLVQEFFYGSSREVMRVIISNWVASIPFSAGLFFVYILPSWFLMRRVPWLFYFNLLVASVLFGFYFFNGGLLSTASVVIAFFLVAIITGRMLRSTVS